MLLGVCVGHVVMGLVPTLCLWHCSAIPPSHYELNSFSWLHHFAMMFLLWSHVIIDWIPLKCEPNQISLLLTCRRWLLCLALISKHRKLVWRVGSLLWQCLTMWFMSFENWLGKFWKCELEKYYSVMSRIWYIVRSQKTRMLIGMQVVKATYRRFQLETSNPLAVRLTATGTTLLQKIHLHFANVLRHLGKLD